MNIEGRLGIRFPRTRAGWIRFFWLAISRCPVHHAKLLKNEPWDDQRTKYGFCCDGVSYWQTGFWHLLRLNYLAEHRPRTPDDVQ